MNKASISKREMDLLVRVVQEKNLELELTGKAGTDEHKSLRSLEDKLGSIGGEKFQVEGIGKAAT